MKTCPKCNNSNRDEAKFCTSCGENLGVQPLDITKTIPLQDTPVTTVPASSDMPSSQPVISNTIPGTSESTGSPKKKSKWLLIVAGIAVIAVVFLLVSFISSANPVNKLIKGVAQLSKMSKVTTTTTIDINYDGDTEEGELVNDMTFKAETAADIDNLLAQVTLELIYDKKSVAQIAAGVNNEDLYVDLKDLYKDKFYQGIEDLLPEYKDYVNDYKIIKKAIDGISLKFDNKEYIKIIKDTLDDDIKGSGNKVTVTLNSKTISKLLEKLLKEAEDDKKLMEAIRKNGIDFIKKVLKEEKNFEIIEVDEFEEALETFEDKDEFEELYNETIASALDSLEYGSDYALQEIQDMEITFLFGVSGKINGMEYTINIDAAGDNLEIISATTIKSGANFTKINKKNAVVIEELISDGDQLEEIVGEVTENLIKTVKKNKKLTERIEELSGEDIEESIKYMMYNIFSFVY